MLDGSRESGEAHEERLGEDAEIGPAAKPAGVLFSRVGEVAA